MLCTVSVLFHWKQKYFQNSYILLLFLMIIGSAQKPGVNFLLGLTFGWIMAFMVSYTSIWYTVSPLKNKHFQGIYNHIMQSDSFSSLEEQKRQFQEQKHREIEQQGNITELNFDDEHEHIDDSRIAKELEKTVRVLCWVMTCPKNLFTKAIHVKKTWGKRCNILIFFSSETNASFPTIGLNVSEGRDHLTAKTRQAFKYIYNKHFNDADWFMKADDDTYVIVENLRYFLSAYNSNDPVYFGQLFKPIVKQGYYSGGAGYVLSKEALRRLYFTDSKKCREDGGAEDVELGRCMELLGVRTTNSTDNLGRTRFHCFDAESHLLANYPPWYYSYDANGGKNISVSDYAISFHYVAPQRMYAFEYYVYHLRPYGIVSGHQNLNPDHH